MRNSANRRRHLCSFQATNTLAASITNDIARARQVPSARVNLRMWSDEVPFRDAARKIALAP